MVEEMSFSTMLTTSMSFSLAHCLLRSGAVVGQYTAFALFFEAAYCACLGSEPASLSNSTRTCMQRLLVNEQRGGVQGGGGQNETGNLA